MPDYLTVPAPQSAPWAPPKQDFSWLGDLPETFYKGREMRRQEALRTAFREGVPVDPKTGGPDIPAMANKIIGIAGPEAAQPYINLWGQMEAGRGLGRAIQSAPTGYEGDEPAPRTPTSGYPARGPNTSSANLRPPARNALPEGYGTEDNIRSMVTEAGITGPAADNIIRGLSTKYFSGDENGDTRNLNADQATQIRQEITKAKASIAQTSRPARPPPPGVGAPADTGAPEAGAPGAPPGAPTMPPGGPRAPGPNDVLAVPRQFDERTIANIAKARDFIASKLSDPRITPAMKAMADEKIKAYNEQIKAANEFYSKRGQVPDSVKEALASTGTPDVTELKRREKYNEVRIPLIQKQQDAIAAGGRAYDIDMAHLFKLAKGILNHPDFYSGVGGNMDLFVNRMKAAMGFGPNAAVPQEMLQKITAMTTLANVNQQKFDVAEAGQNSGRIFSQQVELVSKTVPGLENTPGGNLALVEINDRIGKVRSHIAQMMRDELAAQRRAGNPTPMINPEEFDDKVAAWLKRKENQIITDQERRNPTLLAARTFDSPEAAFRALGEGKVYKNAKGQYVTSHRRP